MPKIVPKSERGSLLGAGNVSELVDRTQATAQGFFTGSLSRDGMGACGDNFLAQNGRSWQL